MITALKKRYNAPTPVRWKNIGYIILTIGAGIQGSIMGLPITDTHKAWINLSITFLTLIGKVLTDLAVQDANSQIQPENINPNP